MLDRIWRLGKPWYEVLVVAYVPVLDCICPCPAVIMLEPFSLRHVQSLDTCIHVQMHVHDDLLCDICNLQTDVSRHMHMMYVSTKYNCMLQDGTLLDDSSCSRS